MEDFMVFEKFVLSLLLIWDRLISYVPLESLVQGNDSRSSLVVDPLSHIYLRHFFSKFVNLSKSASLVLAQDSKKID